MESEVRRDPVQDAEAAPPQTTDSTPTPNRRRNRAAISRARWRFLAEASTVLDRSLDYKETLANVVQLVVPSMADYAGIALLGEDGSLSWGYSAHRDPAKEALARQLRTYQPQLTIADNPHAQVLRSGETR